MEDDFPGEASFLRDATCHTPGCENENVVVRRLMVSTVICGGCGELISDVVIVDG